LILLSKLTLSATNLCKQKLKKKNWIRSVRSRHARFYFSNCLLHWKYDFLSSDNTSSRLFCMLQQTMGRIIAIPQHGTVLIQVLEEPNNSASFIHESSAPRYIYEDTQNLERDRNVAGNWQIKRNSRDEWVSFQTNDCKLRFGWNTNLDYFV